MAKKNTKKPDTRKLIGYARVSTSQQNLQMQIDALIETGVDEQDIHKEQISGRADNRPALGRAKRQAVSGDTFVVYKLDRLGRDLSDLIRQLKWFADEKITFKSIADGICIDLWRCSAAAKLQVHMICSFAQFDVDNTRERTVHGIQRAQARGVKIGAKPKLDEKDVPKAMKMISEGKSRSEVARSFGVSPQTIYRRIKEREEKMKHKSSSNRDEGSRHAR